FLLKWPWAYQAGREVLVCAGIDTKVQPEHHDRRRDRDLRSLGHGREGTHRDPGAAGRPGVSQGGLPRDSARARAAGDQGRTAARRGRGGAGRARPILTGGGPILTLTGGGPQPITM